MGCADDHSAIGHYVKKNDVKLAKIYDHLGPVSIRLRSLQDPAVQALIVTEGAFTVGMDSKLKFALSLLGLLLSLTFLCFIVRSCIGFQRNER